MRKQRILHFFFLLFMWTGLESSAQQANNPKALYEDLLSKMKTKAEMIKDYQSNGNQFKDAKAFFLNEMEIVKTAESFLRLANGKKDLEDDVMTAKKYAETTLFNLFVGASQFVYSEPAVSVRLLDEYFRAVASSQFSDLKLTVSKEAYYVYATALEATGGDKTKIEASLKKALTSDYGATACQQLQYLYHERGEQDSYKRYLEYGFKNFPEALPLSIKWLTELSSSGNYAAVIRDADIVIGRINNGTIENNDDAWSPFYFKAAALFNSEQYEKAYKAFAEGDTKYPGHTELLIGAGTSAAKYAQQQESDPATARQWLQKAVTFYKKAEKAFPDRSYEWGYLLYSCYKQLGDSVMAAKYKKYAE